MQSQSFLAHHQAMSKKKRGKQNLQTLFEVENGPSDNQIRNLLDPLDPMEFAPHYAWIWQKLSPRGGLEVDRTNLKTRLIALDGMGYHSSTQISCPNCSTRRDRSGPLLSRNALAADGQAGLRTGSDLFSREDPPSGWRRETGL